MREDQKLWPRPIRRWELAGTGERVLWRGKEYVMSDEAKDGHGNIQITLLITEDWKDRIRNVGISEQ